MSEADSKRLHPSVQLLGPSLEATLARLVAILDGVDQGFQVLSFDWRYLYVNEAVARHARTTRAALLGRTMQECFPGIGASELFATLETCMARREVRTFDNHFRYADGSSAWFEVRVEPCADGLIVFSTDITQRKELEARYLQAQKMEAVGRLAGGVAHDFNNLLSVILSYTSLLLEDLPRGDARREELLEVQRAAERGHGLTRQLLTLSRRPTSQDKLVDLNGLLAGIAAMVRRLVGEDIRLKVNAAPGIGLVRADPGLMEQVLLNLVVNARDAMPQGGTLTLETNAATLDEASHQARPSDGLGSHVVLAVSDTGVGMDEATKDRLFEPFFTTKPPGKGTGLGLATVFGIVQQAGGHVWVYSEPGRGSTFKVYLPRADEAARDSPVPTRPPPAVRTGTETILLAEDDEQVRAVAEAVLRRAGYTVLSASSGRGALERAAAEPVVHLLLTDVVMPDLGGRELAQQLLSSRPSLRVLYMTGYTESHVQHHRMLDEGVELVEKPLTPEGLLRRVREVLDHAHSA